MKALTVWQPWSSLIAHGWKGYEFRPKPPPRGVIGHRVAIHASKRPMKMAEIRDLQKVLHNAQDARQHGFDSRLEALRFVNELAWKEPPPLGAFVCTAVVGEPLTRAEMAAMLDIPADDLDGLNYAIPLRQARPCPHIPARGYQGWWNVPGDIAERIAQ